MEFLNNLVYIYKKIWLGFDKNCIKPICQLMWWSISAILALGKLKQEDPEPGNSKTLPQNSNNDKTKPKTKSRLKKKAYVSIWGELTS
jgi:hypothetical protein